MKGSGVILKMTAVAILFLFVIASVGQADIKTIIKENEVFNVGKGGSRALWEDHFNDASKIDPNPPGSGMSDNYVVSGGKVKMINTYEAWTDSSWTKMRVIDVTNNAGQTLYDYALEMTINYDSDMQSDYDDLRFKHEEDAGEWLSYWIETSDSTQANVWVNIPELQIGTSELYMFYGNPDADSESDFGGVFSDWNEEWSDDEKITNHMSNEGAWDPDVCFNDDDNEFIVAWEEGQAYYPPYQWGFKQEIRASIYESDGDRVVNDKLVYKDSATYYRNENPSIAYGGDSKWLVAFEHYQPKNYPPHNPSASTMDIYARAVKRSGSSLELEDTIVVCNEDNCQADANVEFDSVNNRYLIVWEDARDGMDNYDIWAQRYDTSGNPVGSEVQICSDTNNQCEPWITFDPINSQYFIVWEDGVTANNGPFRIMGGIFDEDLDEIWTGTIAEPDDYPNDDIDYNYPCVYFTGETEEYLVTWNDGDISDDDFHGNIWGKILNPSGGTVVDTFTISSGNYVRTDIVTYSVSDFDTPYFVTYDDGDVILGKFVTADGEPSLSSVQLCVSDDPDMDADWAKMDIGDGKIFVAWEDKRVDYPTQYDFLPDIYSNLWELEGSSGSSVSYSVGNEKDQILLAHVTSIEIQKGSSDYWDEFNAIGSENGLDYSILDGITGNVLIASIDPGDSLSDVTADSIRLMGTFTRSTPSSSPEIDYWSVSWIQNNPPNTPSNPDPEEGATDVDVDADLSWTGGDPDGDTVYYDVYFGTSNPPPLKATGLTDTTYDPGTMDYGETYYWKIVAEDEHGAETEGPIWDFTTWINNPPNTPSDPDPEDGATDVDVDADLSWSCSDPDGDDLTYDVYFGTSSPPPKVASGITETTYDPGTMNADQTYYWKIVAEDEHGAETEGPIWSFTTASNDPPYPPSDPDPEDGATNVDINADLSWTGGDPNPGDTVKYDIYFGTESPPPLIVTSFPDTTYDPGAMEFETKYYWQIEAKDTHGATTMGPEWSFTTGVNDPPYTPSNPDPPDGATDVTIDYVLSWDGGDPNPEDTVLYDLYLGVTNPPDIFRHDLEDTFYDISGMDYDILYYWRIVSKDNHGAETEGPVWQFTTEQGEDNDPPDTPRIEGPFLVSVNIEYEYTVWATDPEGEDVFYRIYWGDGTTGWSGPYTSGEEITFSHTWTDPWKPYIITVSAKDINNNVCAQDGRLPIFTPRNAQSRGSITVRTVEFEDHFPSIRNAFLILKNEEGRIIRIGRTNFNGEHTFSNLPVDQTYKLKLIKRNHQPITMDISLTYEDKYAYKTVVLEWVGPLWIRLLREILLD